MRSSEANRKFDQFDRDSGRSLYTMNDLRKIFPDDKDGTFYEGLRRLVADGTLERIAQGSYRYARARDDRSYRLERIAAFLRRGFHSYLSLETVLSQHDWISQIPVELMTVMTTGRSQVFETPYGTIEFTHTIRTPSEIMRGTRPDKRHPLRVALPEFAYEDLRRVNRNLHLVNIPEEDAERLRPFSTVRQDRAIEHELDGMPTP